MANIHPLQAMQSTIGAASGDPRPLQRASLFNNANDGPAKIIAKVSGVQGKGIHEDDVPYFTNNEGIPFPDPAHSKTVGGLPLASDTFLFQKQQHFNRSKNLERMVHPCGSGAFGYFETTADVSALTKANFLDGKGVKTPIFMRFSTVTLGREFPDLARNPRGFAIKFYTGEGNYDIVGLNWPVFFCRDPIQGPDVIRSQSRSPKNFLLDYNSLFDLLALTPEANHAGMMFFSDYGTPDGWSNNHGYERKFVYIKYHFLAKHSQKQFTADQATKISGEDPDYSKRGLWEAMKAGKEVEWTAHVQIMQPGEADANKLGFDPFDVTKVWPRAQFPLHEFGKLVLNKNPENFHRDVEQAAFSPGSMVPGVEDSPDPLLQFRIFFYRDAHSLNFDGGTRNDANHAGNPQYVPNSFKHKFRPDTAEAPYTVSDNIVSRKSHYHHEGKLSDYDQARELYTRVMTDSQCENLHRNTANLLRFVTAKVIKVGYLAQAIYDLLPETAKSGEEGFEFVEVQNRAKGAELAGKEAKFRQSRAEERLVGFSPEMGLYNV
ncbi:heme-dependent catalase [Hyaloscypha hepaticicola]|uniref:Heme-dependent catalase n=1 Tax=Hyaloscypha hepaticicola TaxID=2082293 RepID=A0A2J6PX08_9HELO|nr:heme-dependent catalase [Hyaloscypha hepaticicola]